MYIKIHNPKESGGNTGSSADLVNYLDKENKEKDILDKEYFFSQYQDDFSTYKVQQILDNNKKGLKSNETKFFMITINPSEKELLFLQNSKEAIREYTRLVMDEYAKNFDRELDGRKFDGNDLVYFAKIEENRMYKPEEYVFKDIYSHNQGIRSQVIKMNANPSVVSESTLKAGKEALAVKYIRNSEGTVILPGNKKDGLNTHVHVVVSRKDQSQRLSLSPLSNSRGSKNVLNGRKVQIGFERTRFVENSEKLFDTHFGYNRSVEESYEFKHAKKHDASKYFNMLISMNGTSITKQLVIDVIERDRGLRKLLYFPGSTNALRTKIINKSVDKLTTLIAGSTPQGAVYTIAKKVIQKAAKSMIKGIDIGI